MCVRTEQEHEAIEFLRERLSAWLLKILSSPKAKTEQFPGELGMIVRAVEGGGEIVAASWGLQPKWSEDATFGKKNAYNARAETVAEKPTFRDAFRRGRRCIVPISAFYERANGHWLRAVPKDAPGFGAAGLYEPPVRGNEHSTYTLITTTPNEVIGEVHDRMPVLLDPEDWAAWLDPTIAGDTLRGLLVPTRPESFTLEDAGPIGKKKAEPPSLFD